MPEDKPVRLGVCVVLCVLVMVVLAEGDSDGIDGDAFAVPDDVGEVPAEGVLDEQPVTDADAPAENVATGVDVGI